MQPCVLNVSDVGKTRRILVTGGASANDRILQIISDVFNAPVYIQVMAKSKTFLRKRVLQKPFLK